jgi:hypothetical protein
LAFLALSAVFVGSVVAAEPLFAGGFLLVLGLGVPLYLVVRARRTLREVVLADRA